MNRGAWIFVMLGVALFAQPVGATLTDNSDGTISDNVTGLRWRKAPLSGTYLWGYEDATNQGALYECAQLGSGWRLPSRNELLSIVDFTVKNPAMNALFTYTSGEREYWTSTTNVYGAGYAWMVDFETGALYGADRDKGIARYVRCVRDDIHYQLTVARAGAPGKVIGVDGSTTVIECPAGTFATCDKAFPDATHTVNLTATLDACPGDTNNTFAWVVDGTTSCLSATCSVLVDAIITATVTMTSPSYDLTVVNTTGTGQGTVTDVLPSGTINCDLSQTDCTEPYPCGTTVQLHAQAEAGSTMASWTVEGDSSADCSDPTADCTVHMTAGVTVTARFDLTSSLTVKVDDGTAPGNGKVSEQAASPQITNCDGTCTGNYVKTTNVILQAEPNQGYKLDKWAVVADGPPETATAECGDATQDCTVNMSENKTVTATFKQSFYWPMFLPGFTKQTK